jgi:glyoxylase-like metal-dependent hydrolase (beta-lactamase superfamily II)
MTHTNDVTLVPNEGWDERILVCRNDPLVDAFIILTQRYLVLVDTMINPATAEKLVKIGREKSGDAMSLLVLNTHADYDHCWGNQIFGGEDAPHRALIVGSKASAARFAAPEMEETLAQMKEKEPAIFGDVIPTPPLFLFEDRLEIDGNDLTLELFLAPGHTPDHAALYIPEIDTLLAADAAELPYPMARTVEGLPAMRRSLADLAALDAETVLYCHAPPQLGPQLLHDNIAYFDKVEAACRAALARGVAPDPAPDADVIALVDLPYAEAVPDAAPWQNVPESYQTTGHAAQIRMMLAWLSGES